MAERLIPLPEMQAHIDTVVETYGEDATLTYSIDGTTCVILSPREMGEAQVYISVIEIDLPTHRVRVRELSVDPDAFDILTDWHGN